MYRLIRLSSVIAIATWTLFSSIACTSEYDDTSLWEAIKKQEARISALEAICAKINSDLSALSSIVDVFASGDVVTSVTPVILGGKEVGYTITFLKNPPVTVMNGRDGTDGRDGIDGKDGTVPRIGLGQDEDGNWYWMIDGTWLRDSSGNRIRANGKDGTDGKDGADGKNGTDGKDGADGKDGTDGSDGADGEDGEDGRTPQIRIEEGWWCISYDDGTTWERIGKVNEYADEHSCGLIDSLVDAEDRLTINLTDGSVIVLPKCRPTPSLAVILDLSDRRISAGETVSVKYSVSGACGTTKVKALAQGGWKAVVLPSGTPSEVAPGVDAVSDSGLISITAPDPFTDDETIILVSDSEGRMAMESISFEERTRSSYSMNARGDSLEIYVSDTSFLMVKVPGGSFEMGDDTQYESQGTSYGFTNPKHRVTLSRDYWIGIRPMDERMLAKFVSVDADLISYAGSEYQKNTKDFIHIGDVQSVLDGMRQDCGLSLRLPTEAEAEYAFLGGFSRGSTQVSDWMSYNQGWFSWGFDISADATDPTGPPSSTPMSWPADENSKTLEQGGYDSWYKVRKSSGSPHRRYTTRRYPIIVALDDDFI